MPPSDCVAAISRPYPSLLRFWASSCSSSTWRPRAFPFPLLQAPLAALAPHRFSRLFTLPFPLALRPGMLTLLIGVSPVGGKGLQADDEVRAQNTGFIGIGQTPVNTGLQLFHTLMRVYSLISRGLLAVL